MKELVFDPLTSADWTLSTSNELGRMAQGVGRNTDGTQRTKGTDTIFFIPYSDVPKGRKVTYIRKVCTYRPDKSEPNRTRFTAMGNLITDYTGKISTETAGLELIKMHWNSVLSTNKAKYMTMDISNMYLNTPLDRFEYMRMPLTDIPQEIIDEYNLSDLVTPHGWIYMEIRKALYGLSQSGALAAKKLAADLKPFGYYKCPTTAGLWKHESRPITFTLVVNDFGVKYVDKADAEHLENALKANYPMTTDWTGNKYIGITLDWNYSKREMRSSMPGYVQKALKQFNYVKSSNSRQNSPSPYVAPKFGSRQPQMTNIDTSAPMTPKQKFHLQRIVGKFLYYARATDETMGHGLNDLSTKSEGTAKTLTAQQHFLDYCHCNPNAVKLYKASDMILFVDSDASYLTCPGSKSRAGGFFYLGNKDESIINGSILYLTTIIKNVMASAAESEIAALFLNARLAIPLRNALREMGHPQPPTRMKTDNNTASGFANNTIKQNKTKAIEMRFDWLKCRSAQLQFDIYWAPGQENLADYFTKHHSAAHHIALRAIYLAPEAAAKQLSMQGCIKVLQSRLAKKIPVTTIQSHIPSQQSQRSPLAQIQPVSTQTHKQRIQTAKQHKPARFQIPLYKPVSNQIPNTVVQAPAPLIPLQDHHIKWIQAPVCRYNKQLQTVI